MRGAGEPPTKRELADALAGSAKAVDVVNSALTAISTPEQAANLAPGTVHHLMQSSSFAKVGHDITRERGRALAAGVSKAVAAGGPVLRRSWDNSRPILMAHTAVTSDEMMRALAAHALTSDCFGAMDGTSTLPAGLRVLLRSALVPSSGCRNRTKADAKTVAEVGNARSHPYTPARACACGRARGTLARRVVTQALNLDDVAFVLWWLAFAALTNIGNDPNATVVLEVLIMRAVYATQSVVPGLAQADAALRDMLSPHAEDWYMPHGLRVHATVMARQVRDPRAWYRPRRWFVRSWLALRANANILDGVSFVASPRSINTTHASYT